MLKAFERSSSVLRLGNQLESQRRIPYYMYRKVLNYVAQAALVRGLHQRRFYLVRLAAAMGEMDGARRRHRR